MMESWLCVPMPLRARRWWLGALAAGSLTGMLVWESGLDLVDTALADRIVAANPRTASPTTTRVVFDTGMPLSLSREQSLPLAALAMERLAALGARSLLFDGQIALRNWRGQRLPACLPPAGELVPQCSLLGADACTSQAGRPRLAPLDLDPPARKLLRLPPPLTDRQPPPYALLFGAPPLPRLLSPELPIGADGVVRAVYLGNSGLVGVPSHAQAQRCQTGRDCLLLRFNLPGAVLPLSTLAACTPAAWQVLAPRVAGRDVVLQLNDEATTEDVHLTPGSQLRSGGSIIESALATSALDDGPRRLALTGELMGVALLMLATVAACAWLRGGWLLLFALVELALGWHGAPRVYPYAYWPATALLAAQAVAAATIFGGHLYLRTRHYGVLARFLPAPVRHRLLVDGPAGPRGVQLPTLVLMSDLAGYVGLSSRLASPRQVFELINDYLDAASQDMQERHGAWLESYTGDAVCYYWPLPEGATDGGEAWRRQAVAAAMGMMARQREFFAALPQRLDAALPAEARTAVVAGLFAGIALVEGETCMGEIGPRQGIRKFGILGDPLNLAARMEALTRHVRGHLLATETLVPSARALGLLPRRLASIQFKGRLQPVAVWVLHAAAEGVTGGDLAQWTDWLAGFEAGVEQPVPAAFADDAALFQHWRKAGEWDAEARCFRLDDK